MHQKAAAALIIVAGACLYLVHLRHSNVTGFIELPRWQCSECNWIIDGYGHEDYIRRIAQRRRIPTPSACWECHQPPLYYVLSGVVYGLSARFTSVDPWKAVGLVSFLCMVAFVIFGERLLRLEVASGPPYYLSLGLLVFWPLQSVMASRIGNDPPFYMADAGVLYYILRWRRDRKAWSLSLAVLWSGFAMAFKYTAIITLPFVLCVIAYDGYRTRSLLKQLATRPIAIAFCLCLALAVPPMARTYWHYRIETHGSLPLLVPTAPGLVESMPVSNDRLRYFLVPEPTLYLTGPFLGQGTTHPELTYFVNYMMKTSLFGFVRWSPVATAKLLNAVLWLLFAYLALSSAVIAMRDHSFLGETWPLMLFALSHVLALTAYRLSYPHIGNQDFRFVYSATIAMVVLLGAVLAWYGAHRDRIRHAFGAALASVFVASSVSFILAANFRW